MAYNSKEYEYSDINVIIGGKPVQGLRGVKYVEKQEKDVLYTKGNKGSSIQRGNLSYEGEISMTQSEYESLRTLGNGSIMGLTLTVQVAYGNPSKGDVMITDEIQFLEFTEASKEMKQGDKFMEMTLPFIALDVVKIS